jgi:hypothetical protein
VTAAAVPTTCADVDSIRRRLEEARRTSDDLARQVRELDNQIKRLEAEHKTGEDGQSKPLDPDAPG